MWFDLVEHFRHRYELLVLPVILVERHELNETNINLTFFRKFDEVDQFVVVEVAHRNHVELNALKTKL